MGSLGVMQDFPLRIMRLTDHAEREHGKLSKKDLRDQYRDYRFAAAEAMAGRD